jgi:hypothetical protein
VYNREVVAANAEKQMQSHVRSAPGIRQSTQLMALNWRCMEDKSLLKGKNLTETCHIFVSRRIMHEASAENKTGTINVHVFAIQTRLPAYLYLFILVRHILVCYDLRLDVCGIKGQVV